MTKRYVLSILLFLGFSCFGYAQINLKIPTRLSPFLGIKDLKATGDLKNRNVKVSMLLWNHFSKPIQAIINLEGFEKFGITDERGRMYQFSLTKEIGNSKGLKIDYLPISRFEYEGRKINNQRTLKVMIPVGKGRRFSFFLINVDRKIKTFRELHFKNAVLTNKIYDDKTTSTESFNIQWM